MLATIARDHVLRIAELLGAGDAVELRRCARALEEIASEKAGALRVVKLDVDANPNTARDFQVVSIPTMILFKGGQAVKTVVGAYPKKKIESELDSVLAAA